MVKATIKRLFRRLPKSVQGWLAYRMPQSQTSCYSQFGEDLLLAHHLPKTDGFYVDIGAFHPKFVSNTYSLWRRGWKGINIDVDDYKIALFNRFRPDDTNLTYGISSEPGRRPFFFQEGESYGSMSSFDEEFANDRGEKLSRNVRSREVDVITLDALLQEHLPCSEQGELRRVDLLSIDVEGHEHEILRVFDFERFRPKCICVEIHATGLEELLQDKTYQLITGAGYHLAAWPSPSCLFLATEEKEADEKVVSFRVSRDQSTALRSKSGHLPPVTTPSRRTG